MSFSTLPFGSDFFDLSSVVEIDLTKSLPPFEEQLLIKLILDHPEGDALFERELKKQSITSRVENFVKNENERQPIIFYNVPYVIELKNGDATKTYTVVLKNKLAVGHSLSRGKHALRIHHFTDRLGAGGIASTHDATSYRLRRDEDGDLYLHKGKKQRVGKLLTWHKEDQSPTEDESKKLSPDQIHAKMETTDSQATTPNRIKTSIRHNRRKNQKNKKDQNDIDLFSVGLMNKAKGVELYKYLELEKDNPRKIILIEKLKITIALLRALKEFHDLGYIHRDIKSENMIIDPSNGQYKIKLIDEGMRTFYGEGSYTFCGTPQFVMPEVQYDILGNYLSDRTDVGSMALLLMRDLWQADFVFQTGGWYLVTGGAFSGERSKFLDHLEMSNDEQVLIEKKEADQCFELIKRLSDQQRFTDQKRFEVLYRLSSPDPVIVPVAKKKGSAILTDIANVISEMLRLHVKKPSAKSQNSPGKSGVSPKPAIRLSLDEALEKFELIEAKLDFSLSKGGYGLSDQSENVFKLAIACRKAYQARLKNEFDNLSADELIKFFDDYIQKLPNTKSKSTNIKLRKIFLAYLNIDLFRHPKNNDNDKKEKDRNENKLYENLDNFKQFIDGRICEVVERYNKNKHKLLKLKEDIALKQKIQNTNTHFSSLGREHVGHADKLREHLEDVDNALLKEHRYSLNPRPQFFKPSSFEYQKLVHQVTELKSQVFYYYLEEIKAEECERPDRIYTLTVYWKEHHSIRQKKLPLTDTTYPELLSRLKNNHELTKDDCKLLRHVCAHDAMSLDQMASVATQYENQCNEIKCRMDNPKKSRHLEHASLKQNQIKVVSPYFIKLGLSASVVATMTMLIAPVLLALKVMMIPAALAGTFILGSFALPYLAIGLGVAGLLGYGSYLYLKNKIEKLNDLDRSLVEAFKVPQNAHALPNENSSDKYSGRSEVNISEYRSLQNEINRHTNRAVAVKGILALGSIGFGLALSVMLVTNPLGWAIMGAGVLSFAGAWFAKKYISQKIAAQSKMFQPIVDFQNYLFLKNENKNAYKKISENTSPVFENAVTYKPQWKMPPAPHPDAHSKTPAPHPVAHNTMSYIPPHISLWARAPSPTTFAANQPRSHNVANGTSHTSGAEMPKLG